MLAGLFTVPSCDEHVRDKRMLSDMTCTLIRKLEKVGYRGPLQQRNLRIFNSRMTGRRIQGRRYNLWKDEVETDIRKMGIRNWKQKTTIRPEWERVVQQAKAHPELVEEEQTWLILKGSDPLLVHEAITNGTPELNMYIAPTILSEGNYALGIPWRDHWMQAIYFLPSEREVKKGELLTLRGWHDEFSLWFETGGVDEEKSPVCNCGFHLISSRTRIGSLNDPFRRSTYLSAVSAMSEKTNIFVVLGDFSLLGLLCAKIRMGKVFIFVQKDSVLHENVWKEFISANKLSSVAYIYHDIPSIVGRIGREVATGNISWEDICVLGEPYFETSLLAWENIYYWTLQETFLKEAESFVNRDNVVVFLKSLSIKACCVQFDDFWKISGPLGKCMGLDMTIFDNMILKAKTIAQKTPEPQPLWEYPCRTQSEAATLITLDLKSPPPDRVHSTFNFSLDRDSKVNGVVFWVEYELFNDSIISTGPLKPFEIGEYLLWDRFERQGVHLFNFPIDGKNIITCSVKFDPKLSEFDFRINEGQIKA